LSKYKHLIGLGILMILMSVVFYVIYYERIHDTKSLIDSIVANMAFTFVQILLWVIIIERVLADREKRLMMEKMNMVIGTFFSEVGTKLINDFTKIDTELDSIRKELIVTNNWGDAEFALESRSVKKHGFNVKPSAADLIGLKAALRERRDFLLRLLENPVLLEHETFTELLRAVFHINEELESRDDLTNLPASDMNHLAVDIKRAYSLLTVEWLEYMKHLKASYPYLFSHAVRTNPFDREASPIVTS